MVHEITDATFESEVMNSDVPCVIEFSAEWCAPCAKMALTLASLSEKLSGEVKFCSADIEKNKKLRIKFAVAAIPYIVFVADSMQTPLFDELVTEERLEERIRFMLDGGTAPTTRPL